MNPRPIILDCDPGHDDALAITLALARPELELLGITTVGGNSPLANTTRNALRVLALLDRNDVPVAAGAERALLREPWIPVEFHGASGLDGADLPEAVAVPRPEGALALAEALVAGAGRPVTLVATAPLTNIALLLRARPRICEGIERICLMGGSLGEGNTTAAAEFNIWQDPEAAAIVLGSGIPISMITLDVTHRALFLEPDVARLEALGTRIARVWVDLLRFFAVYHRRRYGWDGSPIHDAVAVAHLADPGLVPTRPLRVDVETAGELTRGRTVADPEGLRGLRANVEVGVDIDRGRFADMLVEAIASFG
jgi:pyrimidine-specific ribonucleoside hydrolase